MKDMYKAADWNGKGFSSREHLMEKLQSKRFETTFAAPTGFRRRVPSAEHHATTQTIGILALSSYRVARTTMHISRETRKVEARRRVSPAGPCLLEVSPLARDGRDLRH